MMKMLYLLLIVWGAYTAEASTCKTVWEDKCMDVPRQECRTVQKPYPVTRSEEECNTFHDNQCSTVFDTEVDVVDRQECQTVKVPKHVSMPVKICDEMPEQKCETKYAEECHTEYEKECSTNYEVVCGDTLHEEVCDTSLEYKTDIKKEKKCHLETETQCHETPFTDCQTVKKPVTKYRDEEECRTVYDQVCVPSYEESCHTVTERQCKTVTETECDHNNRCWDEEHDECWDEPRQECKQTPKKVCNNVPRQKCTTVHHPYTDYEDKQECSTTNKPVCRQVPVYKCYDVDTPVNHLVPRRKCQNQPRKVCKKVHKQDCKDVPRQKCDSVPKQDCQTLPTQDCRIEYNQITSFEDKEECRTVQDKVDRKVARQVCNKVPRKECRQVPVTKTVFKDETECSTRTEQKCTQVSREICGSPAALFLQIVPMVSKLPCCNGPSVESCQQFIIDTSFLGQDELMLKLKQTIELVRPVEGSEYDYHYENDNIEMALDYHPEDGSLYGYINEYGTKYAIDSCGNKKYVLKKYDDDDDDDDDDDYDDDDSGKEKESSCIDEYMVDDDNDTIATYSIKVYYTPEVEAAKLNIEQYIKYLIDYTNMGYKNSNVPIRVKLHCIELAKIEEEPMVDGVFILKRFAKLKNTLEALRGSADAAALLVTRGLPEGQCGLARYDTICDRDKDNISITVLDCCARGDGGTFAHEIGHNFGLCHDRDALLGLSCNTVDGNGYLFRNGDMEGYYTIMAYSRDGYRKFDNYYSNPDIIHPKTGTPTGRRNYANSARVLRARRFAMAAVGDESQQC